jgi:iron complex outermembrane recepter protein
MRKFIMLLLSMCVFTTSSFGQSVCVIKGKVVDENNEPLTGATVILYPVKKATITDASGNYVIEKLPIGNYKLEISFMGYISHIDSVTIDGKTTHNAQLMISALSLQEVVVTDNYTETRKKEESLNIEIVNDDYLKQNLGGSLMNSLERLPGITTIDIGSGQSKPVIRGLGFNRVVVVENDIKHEAQQWGADHGLEIDQYAVDNVEIIKGPASLEYGSDAIGGVIDMENRKLPAPNSLGGTIDLSGKTNNDFLGTSISLYGRKNWLFADFRATLLDYGDYKVPTETVDVYGYKPKLYKNHLRNTAGNEQDLHLSFGVIKKRFQSKLFVSSVNSKSGFFANAHGLEPLQANTDLHDKSNRDIQYPYQTVNHFKVTNSSFYRWEQSKLEWNLGFQRNYREELNKYTPHGYMPAIFPDTLSFPSDLERQFDKKVYSGNIKYHCESIDNTQFKLGINSEYQNNTIDGVGFLIPSYRQLTLGVFALAKYSISEISSLQAGIRYDYGAIQTEEYVDWFQSRVIDENNDTTWQYLQRAKKLNRNFSNFTWSAGYNFNPGQWSYKVNIGKSFRMPIAKELAANGVNYHYFRYEIGKANLSPEVSYQLDAGIEYNGKIFAVGTAPFVNYFSNYIYLNPTSDHDDGEAAGLQKFYYTQSIVYRYGAEIHAHYQLLKSLQLGVLGEYVYSEQLSGEKKGYTLPFSPPASAIFNIKYQKQKISRKLSGLVENAYMSVDYRITAPQDNIVPPEETTDGHQVINLGLGGDVKIGNQKADLSIQVQNLLNTKYFNHTSFYRLINVPESGRNFIVNISIPFSGKLKQLK